MKAKTISGSDRWFHSCARGQCQNASSSLSQ